MNYKQEAIEILKASIKEDSEMTAKALLMSLREFADSSGITLESLKQVMSDLWWEIESPEIEEIEHEEPVIEVGSIGIFDS